MVALDGRDNTDRTLLAGPAREGNPSFSARNAVRAASQPELGAADVVQVGDATNDTRWGNVMYIGAAPSCPRNDIYRATLLDRFVRGASPVDFPSDDFEVDFLGRATIADLDDIGRAQVGLA